MQSARLLAIIIIMIIIYYLCFIIIIIIIIVIIIIIIIIIIYYSVQNTGCIIFTARIYFIIKYVRYSIVFNTIYFIQVYI